MVDPLPSAIPADGWLLDEEEEEDDELLLELPFLVVPFFPPPTNMVKVASASR